MRGHFGSPFIGHTFSGGRRPTGRKAAVWSAALAFAVVALVLAGPASTASAAGKSNVASVWESISRLIQGNTAQGTETSAVANETFTLYQGFSADVDANVIVDVQPYLCDLTADQIATLHAQNPDTKVIRYVDTLEAIDTVTAMADGQTWSLDYARRLNTDAEWLDLWANHQSWFLKDSGGLYINRPSGNANEMNPKRAYLMDPGSAGWRDWLVAKVAQRLSAGYDGVFLDLCAPTPAGYTATPAKYAGNYGYWRADINGLIDHIKSKCPAALVITNTFWQGQSYYANASPNPIDDNDEDGTEIEGFIYSNGSGPTETEANWVKEIQIVAKLCGEGKIVLARTGLSTTDPSSPKRLLGYSIGTFILGKTTSAAYFGFHTRKAENGYDLDYLAAIYGLPLGDAVGAYYQGGIAYGRDFKNGKVIVNPNDAGLSHVYTPLASARFQDQDGNIYDSAHPLVLPAKSGAILVSIAAAPYITAVSPSVGSTLGGDSVVITGGNLTGASAVTFGDLAAAQFTVDSATRITATMPARVVGTVSVQVTTPTGTSPDTPADDLIYEEPGTPTITSLSPNTGSVGGGTTVTINGTGFTGLSGTSAVTFDGIDAVGYKVVSSVKITAVTPAHAAGTARVQVAAAGGTTADTASDDFTFSAVARYDQTNKYIVKTGVWADYPKAAAYLASYGRSNTTGATATVWFSGTRIRWIAMKGTTGGTADVYLDGAKVGGVNLTASVAAYQVDVYASPALANGMHNLKIVNTSANYLTLDAVDITGVISPPLVWYQQTDAHIVKTGIWSTFAKSSASGGSYGRASTASASATIAFTGTRLDWMAMKGTTAGYAYVYLDGATVPTAKIDLWSATSSYQVTVWSTGALKDGSHTVRILRDDKDSGANGFITLDAIGVWGSLK